MPHTHELSIRLPVTVNAPRSARSAVDTLPLDGRHQAQFNLRLLISELVGNSVRHAGLSPSDSITVEIQLSSSVVRAEVTDHGPGFTRPMFDGPPSGTSGRGLFLVAALADRWGAGRTPHDGWLVWFELDFC